MSGGEMVIYLHFLLYYTMKSLVLEDILVVDVNNSRRQPYAVFELGT